MNTLKRKRNISLICGKMSKEETIQHLDCPISPSWLYTQPDYYGSPFRINENRAFWENKEKRYENFFTIKFFESFRSKVQTPQPKFGCTAAFVYFKIKFTKFCRLARRTVWQSW